VYSFNHLSHQVSTSIIVHRDSVLIDTLSSQPINDSSFTDKFRLRHQKLVVVNSDLVLARVHGQVSIPISSSQRTDGNVQIDGLRLSRGNTVGAGVRGKPFVGVGRRACIGGSKEEESREVGCVFACVFDACRDSDEGQGVKRCGLLTVGLTFVEQALDVV
jgi:hypothetical protein